MLSYIQFKSIEFCLEAYKEKSIAEYFFFHYKKKMLTLILAKEISYKRLCFPLWILVQLFFLLSARFIGFKYDTSSVQRCLTEKQHYSLVDGFTYRLDILFDCHLHKRTPREFFLCIQFCWTHYYDHSTTLRI